MNLLPQLFYGEVLIGPLSMVGDGGRWQVVRVGAGSLIYRQIKSLHCSGYLLVHITEKKHMDLKISGGIGGRRSTEGRYLGGRLYLISIVRIAKTVLKGLVRHFIILIINCNG